MTTATRPRPRKTAQPADPLDGIPCCTSCDRVLYENLLGQLVTAELLKPPDAEP
ncbi:MAG: hypothetical protein HOV66_27845 [Streptomycetaceae bacterium]|nr:hypothetical protein [Nocardioidaceae bacterium]NUS58632.1 hypothetical protein [Streptomycetaceae bacterium]